MTQLDCDYNLKVSAPGVGVEPVCGADGAGRPKVPLPLHQPAHPGLETFESNSGSNSRIDLNKNILFFD